MLLTIVQLKGDREEFFLVSQSASVSGHGHHLYLCDSCGLCTMRNSVLKDLRCMTSIAINLGQGKQHWSWRVREFEGAKGFITNNNNGHWRRRVGRSSKSCSS